MKHLFITTLFLLATQLSAQQQSSIWTMDFVKIKDNKQAEALFYYENNWKALRDSALVKGYIKSYKLLKTTADSSASFDLILMTEYQDASAFELSEARFQEIIATRIGGLKLLNALKPNDFRENLFFKEAVTLFQ